MKKLFLLSTKLYQNYCGKRKFYGFIDYAFNAVDVGRLKVVGGDRLCAEWILKHGGSIHITRAITSDYESSSQILINDYNKLPNEDIKFYLKSINATNISITAMGFNHLKYCKHINHITLNECNNMENIALRKLKFIENSLESLHIIKCRNIRENGLLSLKCLGNLKELIIENLCIENMNEICDQLQKHLPKCFIELRTSSSK